MWAKAFGGDLYELQNTPFYVYDLNWGDVVRATTDSLDQKPEIREVVQRSGHQTLRVIFLQASTEQRDTILAELEQMGVGWEGANHAYYALSVEPETDVDDVRDYLAQWCEAELLSYETTEARIPGSFDAFPEDEETEG